jgi:hypothetical protein
MMFLKAKLRLNVLWLALMVWLMNVGVAFADVISEHDADEVGTAIIDLLSGIMYPLGATIIFVCIVIVAFKVIATANNPTGRAEAIGSLPYIIAGGALLGGSLLLAGFVMSLFSTLST